MFNINIILIHYISSKIKSKGKETRFLQACVYLALLIVFGILIPTLSGFFLPNQNMI